MWEYEYTADTSAAPAAIWALWSDVPGWASWNAGVERATIDGPFEPGTRFTMTPPGEEPIELRLADVVPQARFTDVMRTDDFTVTTVHRLEALADGGSRIVYRTEISGPAAATVGPDLGPAITADFPDVVAALARRAESVPA